MKTATEALSTAARLALFDHGFSVEDANEFGDAINEGRLSIASVKLWRGVGPGALRELLRWANVHPDTINCPHCHKVIEKAKWI